MINQVRDLKIILVLKHQHYYKSKHKFQIFWSFFSEFKEKVVLM